MKYEWNMIHAVKQREPKWNVHTLHLNCLLKHVIEGKVERKVKVRRRRGRSSKQLLHDLFYSAGLSSTSVINLSLSKILKSGSMTFALAWNGRRRPMAVRLFSPLCAQAGMFFRVPLPPPTAVRPPHRTENEACCVLKRRCGETTVRALASI